MASSEKVTSALGHVANMPEQEKPAAYESMLRRIKDLSHPRDVAADLKAITSGMLSASLGVVATRTLFDALAATLRDLRNPDMCITVANHAVGLVGAGDSSTSASNFVDQAAALREIVAGAHEAQDEFGAAARALAEIPLDSSQRKVSNKEMARIWVRIVRNYLEVDDTAAAEVYINKLKNIMHTVSSEDAELGLHFQLSQARIEDAKREFLPAAKRYHEISFSTAIAEEERLHTLGAAIKCGILAPAGPLRSRLLGRLYRDERSEQLPDEFSILEKIFFDRLLTTKEVEKFAESLSPHQLAVTADGSTVLTKAIIEHNLLGASRLYANITFEALGKLLGLDAEKAEETTARMIEQGRLVGRMDQLEGVVWFEKGEASGVKSGRAEVLVGKETRRWDANVQGISEEVENVVNALQHEFPIFVAANLAS